MTLRRLRQLVWAPAVMMTAGACLATQQDLRVVQGDVVAVRDEFRRLQSAERTRDSLRAVSLDSALAQIALLLRATNDTVRGISTTVIRLRGDVREDLQNVRAQLIAIQELTGQSQRRIQELRADLESDAIEKSTAPIAGAPIGRDTARAPAPATPGPAQLYQMGQDQLRRGSGASARSAFSALLAQYPRSDLAADALYGMAEAFTAEGNAAAADSAYGQVVARYSNSDRAPTALYKRATALRVAGKGDSARELYRQIIQRYPRSEAAVLSEQFVGSPQRP
ncbi:MAG: tetratricopeptide repeat protein [Gemmatimonadetes bacterium]|nr:tetratricopeptide repeat protein [Gemmatimonadota bacterium]MBM4190894.1 tetratricopeptide repeat protein [Gemmatimonadota bacterium]